MQSKANNTQVGGEHYKSVKHQHWDFAADNGLGYFEGQITKYIARWRRKNGLQDLQKALHFSDKLSELVRDGSWTHHHGPRLVNFSEFAAANGLTVDEGRVCALLASYQTATANRELTEVRMLIEKITEQAESDLRTFGRFVAR